MDLRGAVLLVLALAALPKGGSCDVPATLSLKGGTLVCFPPSEASAKLGCRPAPRGVPPGVPAYESPPGGEIGGKPCGAAPGAATSGASTAGRDGGGRLLRSAADSAPGPGAAAGGLGITLALLDAIGRHAYGRASRRLRSAAALLRGAQAVRWPDGRQQRPSRWANNRVKAVARGGSSLNAESGSR